MSDVPNTQPPFLFFFVVLCILTCSLLYKKHGYKIGGDGRGGGRDGAAASSSTTTADFKAFQRTYLIVYFCAMAADWLQGPYVYALYDSYGFGQREIAVLFVAGFGSSMVFGTFIGSLADRFGRKRFCQLYAAMYIVSCLTKHVNSYSVLMIGRLLGGIATSLLYSAFDSWMIKEHNSRMFHQSGLSDTFAVAIFGNSVVAILSGLVANAAAAAVDLHAVYGDGSTVVSNSGSIMSGGFCAPFDVAIIFLIVGGAYIHFNWGENYGNISEETEGGPGGIVRALSKAIEQIKVRPIFAAFFFLFYRFGHTLSFIICIAICWKRLRDMYLTRSTPPPAEQ